MTTARVLIVEDNQKNMKLFRDVLTAKGYSTIEATTGTRAVELAAQHAPDLVLMDIQLPDLDGSAALGRLRADERTTSIPVLALTAQAMHGDRERFLAAGFDGYISKPVDVVELLATVRRYCETGVSERHSPSASRASGIPPWQRRDPGSSHTSDDVSH